MIIKNTPTTRLNKFIAEHSSVSRRKADELIASDMVFVNGKLVNSLGTKIDPQNDKVTIKGIKLETGFQATYLALNKPQNYICTKEDELGRKTIMDLLPQIANLKPVGRLDKDTEGLILISNDGDFINKQTHPKYNKEKEYYVELNGNIKIEDIKKLERGIELEEKKTSPAKIKLLEKDNSTSYLTITIHEGINRQIKKMFMKLGFTVNYLKRIRIGKIFLGNLKTGEYRPLNKFEIYDIKHP